MPGDHHAATRNPEVQRLVQPLAAVLHQHVLAGHTEVGGTILHVSGYIRRADDHQLHVGVIGVQDEFAAAVRIVQRFDAGVRQQRQRFGEDTALGQSQGELFGHTMSLCSGTRRER